MGVVVAGEPEARVVVKAEGAQGVLIGDHSQQHIHHHYPTPAETEWPVLVGRAPLRAAAFQERAEAVGQPGTTILAGDGGAGKTQLAAAAFDTALRSGVDLALWVTATSRAGVLAAYAQAYELVRASARGGDAERDAEAFLNWLATTARSWIVVLDDLADPAELSKLWPAGPAGRVIVTTRRRDAAISARGPVVDVGVFTPGQSLSYLTAKLAADALRGADELAVELGHLPLALAQAAAVIIDDGITCADYHGLLTDRARRLADLFPSDPQVAGDEYERTLAGTWSLAADRADAMPPRQLARPLLRLAAVLDPNGIPETVLTAPSALQYLGGADARRALRNLHRLSLVAHDPSDPIRSVRMHSLAQRSTIDELAPDDRASLVTAAAQALLEAWPAVERDPGLGPALRANAAAIERAGPSVPLTLSFRVGASLLDAGLASAAAAHFEAMLEGVRRDSADGLRIRHQLALSQGESGDPVGAVAALRTLLAEGRPDDPETLAVQISLAYWRGESGDFAGAARALEPLVAELTQKLGADDPQTIGTRAMLAFWSGHAGDPSGAAAATQELLTAYLLVMDPDHPRVLSTRHNLAHWIGAAGDPAGAVSSYDELLDDCLRMLGPAHPVTLDTARNLAHWRGQLGHPAEALAELETVCADYERFLGGDHPDAMHARENLAYWRGEAGDADGSVTAYEELLAERQRVLGPDHPHTLESRYHLADRRAHAGDVATAIAELSRLAEDRRRILGADHPYTLRTRFKLADWRGQAGGDAMTPLARVLSDQIRVLGPKHPDSLATRHELAFWIGKSGAETEALAAFTDLYADQVSVLGPGHPDTLATSNELARTRGMVGDPVGAMTAYEELLQVCISGLGPDHLETLDVRRNLVEWRAESGDPTTAKAELQALIADATRIMGPRHPRVLEYTEALAHWRYDDVEGN